MTNRDSVLYAVLPVVGRGKLLSTDHRQTFKSYRYVIYVFLNILYTVKLRTLRSRTARDESVCRAVVHWQHGVEDVFVAVQSQHVVQRPAHQEVPDCVKNVTGQNNLNSGLH